MNNQRELFFYERTSPILNQNRKDLFLQLFPILDTTESQENDEDEVELMNDSTIKESVKISLLDDSLTKDDIINRYDNVTIDESFLSKSKYKLLVEYSYTESGYGTFGPHGGSYTPYGVIGTDSLVENDVLKQVNELFENTNVLEM